MRIIFMGTSEFAVPSLRAVAASPAHQLLAVVTQPDRPHGRGRGSALSPVKKIAQELGLPIWQPEKARSPEFFENLVQAEPDALAVAAYGQIIPARILRLPRFGGINVHGSLLPRWRGAAPMQYALIAGDSQTGVTTMQMSAGLDTGDILLQESLTLGEEDNLASVEAKLSVIGASLLVETLRLLEAGACPRAAQDESLATYAPSLAPDIGLLDFTRDSVSLRNLIRGVTPRPGAYFFRDGKRIKVMEATALSGDPDMPSGWVESVSSRGITITTGTGLLLIHQVQPESKGAMSAADWARGARISPGDLISDPPPEDGLGKDA